MRLVVVGGGIAGLAAALRLRDRLGRAAEITIVEQRPAVGGKLRTGELAGLTAERGADAFLVREPAAPGRAGTAAESAAVGLVRRVGLAGELVHPAPVPPALVLAGELRPLPGGTLLGVPGDPAQVAPVAQVDAGRDRDAGRPVLPAGADVAVGELVRGRLGDQVVDRLVDPMLGGVYAGRADTLSLAATMPGLAAACAETTTLAGAVRAALAASPRPPGAPVFASLRGGLGRLVEAVSVASGATVRLGAPVRRLAAAPGGGWRLTVGSTRDPELIGADAVVLALPARPAARLLATAAEPAEPAGPAAEPAGPATEPAGPAGGESVADAAEEAAAQVGALDYASVALVTLALPPSVTLPDWSGFLVPATEGMAVKAVTFLTRKWPHLTGDEHDRPVLVRASVGRYGEPELLRLADAALVQRVRGELAELLGGLPDPLASHVQRWGGALPQYLPGHLDRVAAARAVLPATLRLAGAGYDGVGIPACVRSGETAADQLAAVLEESVV